MKISILHPGNQTSLQQKRWPEAVICFSPSGKVASNCSCHMPYIELLLDAKECNRNPMFLLHTTWEIFMRPSTAHCFHNSSSDIRYRVLAAELLHTIEPTIIQIFKKTVPFHLICIEDIYRHGAQEMIFETMLVHHKISFISNKGSSVLLHNDK